MSWKYNHRSSEDSTTNRPQSVSQGKDYVRSGSNIRKRCREPDDYKIRDGRNHVENFNTRDVHRGRFSGYPESSNVKSRMEWKHCEIERQEVKCYRPYSQLDRTHFDDDYHHMKNRRNDRPDSRTKNSYDPSFYSSATKSSYSSLDQNSGRAPVEPRITSNDHPRRSIGFEYEHKAYNVPQLENSRTQLNTSARNRGEVPASRSRETKIYNQFRNNDRREPDNGRSYVPRSHHQWETNKSQERWHPNQRETQQVEEEESTSIAKKSQDKKVTKPPELSNLSTAPIVSSPNHSHYADSSDHTISLTSTVDANDENHLNQADDNPPRIVQVNLGEKTSHVPLDTKHHFVDDIQSFPNDESHQKAGSHDPQVPEQQTARRIRGDDEKSPKGQPQQPFLPSGVAEASSICVVRKVDVDVDSIPRQKRKIIFDSKVITTNRCKSDDELLTLSSLPVKQDMNYKSILTKDLKGEAVLSENSVTVDRKSTKQFSKKKIPTEPCCSYKSNDNMTTSIEKDLKILDTIHVPHDSMHKDGSDNVVPDKDVIVKPLKQKRKLSEENNTSLISDSDAEFNFDCNKSNSPPKLKKFKRFGKQVKNEKDASGTVKIEHKQSQVQEPSDSIPVCNDVSLVTVGSRVSIYWDGDDAFFNGTVTKVRPGKKRPFKVKYDDGDSEWISFNREKFRLLKTRVQSTSSQDLSMNYALKSRTEHIESKKVEKPNKMSRIMEHVENDVKERSVETINKEKVQKRSLLALKGYGMCESDKTVSLPPGKEPDEISVVRKHKKRSALETRNDVPMGNPGSKRSKDHKDKRRIRYSPSTWFEETSGWTHPEDDWVRAGIQRESSDTDTDEEEVMQWGLKIFGVVRPKIYQKHLLGLKSQNHKSPDSTLSTERANFEIDEKRKKEEARPLTTEEIQKILTEDNASDTLSHWVRRSSRQPSKSALNAPQVKSLIEKLKCNDTDMEVLKMKKYCSDPATPSIVLDTILDGLEENTNCEALYIQNFNLGMRDEQVLHLLKILQSPTCRIWCLNIGETYNVRTETWELFATGLKETNITHMYASEHTISNQLKDEIRETIRLNRQKHSMHNDPNNLQIIVQCTHCWWNPINAAILRPYLNRQGFERILHDAEAQGLPGTNSESKYLS